MTTEERLTKLENNLIAANRRNRWALATAFLLLLGLLVALNMRTPDEVKARRFVVVDAQGQVRAGLLLTADGSPWLALRDTQGELRAELGVDDSGTASLAMRDAQGRARAELGVDDKGLVGLLLSNAQGKPRAALSVDEDNKVILSMNDAQGVFRAGLFVDPTGAAVLGMRDSQGPLSFNCLSNREAQAGCYYVMPKGSPVPGCPSVQTARLCW